SIWLKGKGESCPVRVHTAYCSRCCHITVYQWFIRYCERCGKPIRRNAESHSRSAHHQSSPRMSSHRTSHSIERAVGSRACRVRCRDLAKEIHTSSNK